MHAVDTIGVVNEHRWATVEEQRERLKADGCRVIVDLAKVDRDYLLTVVREGTVVKVLYAFLLAKGRHNARTMLEDFEAFSKRLSKPSPRGSFGIIKDVDAGLVADTPGAKRAMLAIVKHQIARHRQGAKSVENGKRGPEPVVLSELQEAKGEAIWRNPKYRDWDEAEAALQKQVHKDLTKWAAHRRWKARKIGRTTGR
jgi:hypothetical protein